MDVIIMESSAYAALIQTMQKTIIDTVAKHVSPDDRWMTVKEVAAYVGFAPQWVTLRAAEIGAAKTGELRFKKSNVDAYMLKHSFKK